MNAAICNTTSMVHYIDVSTPDKPTSTAINGVREFMSDKFRSDWGYLLDTVRA